jgi:succinate dehydrogenase / fumarate reductase cytochrome b subunit
MATPARFAHQRSDVTSQQPSVAQDRQRRHWLLNLFQSSIGLKYVMAITGIVLMGYVVAHMVGNLKMYIGPESLDAYGEWLRDFGEPVVPRTALLWALRVVLVAAFVLHIYAAAVLTIRNRRARQDRYRSRREYVAADYASRTMRWSGVIVGLFVLFHLMDLTWGNANPDFVRGDVYHNVVESFQRWPVAVAYILANLALGVHLYHGAWSLFQSMGWSHRRFNPWRRYFAIAFTVVVVAGNLSFPIAVLTGVVS